MPPQMFDPAPGNFEPSRHTPPVADPAELLRGLYKDWHRMAVRLMGGERTDHTLQPTALLHEAWIRLTRTGTASRTGEPRSLTGLVARVMCEILIDHARHRRTHKRGASWKRVPLDHVIESLASRQTDLLALHEALEVLTRDHPRQASVITLRFLCGMKVREVAAELDLSESTVEADYRFARAWLHQQLRDDG